MYEIKHLYIYLLAICVAFWNLRLVIFSFLIFPGLLPGWQPFARCYFKMYLNFREVKFDKIYGIQTWWNFISVYILSPSFCGQLFSYWFVGVLKKISTLDISCNFCPVCHLFCTGIELTTFTMSEFCIVPCPKWS